MTKIRFILTWLLLTSSSAAFADATADFNALLDEHWAWTLTNSPVMASMMGDRSRNQDWGDQSLDAIDQRHNETREFLRRTYAIDREVLSVDNQLNYELFRRQLQDDVDGHQFNGDLMPFSHQRGIQTLDGLPTIVNRTVLRRLDRTPGQNRRGHRSDNRSR